MLQSNVLDMAFDKNNFCWLSFANGIQKFDGKNFTNVPVQRGLPDDKWTKFFRCRNGDLLLSYASGISRYEITSNRFKPIYTTITAEKQPAAFLGEDRNIIYFHTDNGSVTGMDNRSYKVVSHFNTGLSTFANNNGFNLKISDNILNGKVGMLVNNRLYLCDLRQSKVLYQSALILNISPFFLRLASEHEVWYYDTKTNNLLEQYNFILRTRQPVSEKPKNSVQTFRSNIYLWQNKTLLSYYTRLYETNQTFKDLLSEYVNFQNKAIAGNSAIAHIREDNFGNLYLVTINEGFRKIIRNNYPINFYGTDTKDDNYVLSVLADKANNRILASTLGNGLLVFDTLQRLVKHIKTLPGSGNPFSVPVISRAGNGDYILYTFGKKIWRLTSNLSQLTSIKITSVLPEQKSGIGYFSNLLYQNNQEALMHSQGRLYRTNFAANTTTEYEAFPHAPMSSLLYNQQIVSHALDELIFLDALTFKELKKVPLKGTGGVRCFAKDDARSIYAGSNKGIFKLDSNGKLLQQWDKTNGLPDECIYAMVFDKSGTLWCSTNKGIFKLNKDNSILHLKKEDGLQEAEFNTNTVTTAADGEIFFGGVNGVSSFFPTAITSTEERLKLLFTDIKINNQNHFKDTAVWNIDKIDLPYHQNSLSFDFIAMADNNPGQYIYQYKMQGIDDEWIQNEGLQTVRYFLPPGEYVFQLYASRFFDKDANPMKELRLTIRPPFWRTWWFIAGLTMIVFAALAYSINQYNRKKYQRRLFVLEAEHNIQLERERISRELHDDLGTRANMLAYNTSLLHENNTAGEIKEIKERMQETSGEMLQSLRETVWTLKQEAITAHDVWTRFKNFIAKMQRTYSGIQFKLEEEEAPEKKMNYNEALNTIRILQEAVNNAVRHAACTVIRCKRGYNGKEIVFVIEDNGKGEETFEAPLAAGNGMENMRHRATESSFALNIYSAPGEGCRVMLLV